MGLKEAPKLILFKLFTLLFVVVLLFFIFNEILNIAFVESSLWSLICWGFIYPLIVIIFFIYGTYQQRLFENVDTQPASTLLRITDIILNSMLVAFLVFIFSAFYTMYFAKNPFSEKVKIINVYCKKSFGMQHSLLPSFTIIQFKDLATQNDFNVAFRNYSCQDRGDFLKNLPGQSATLKGRSNFFGMFYDHIELNKQ